GRRWNLRLDNGVDVELPEAGINAAWRRLADIERRHRLLSRDITAIDLRLPDRLVVRPAEAFRGWRADGEST
ncbi:MAG: cell division protein FtsQ, partial [Proteobacteria bacterium]|nr:cell division protein FtsQ [Pseudomonadota bacterium]